MVKNLQLTNRTAAKLRVSSLPAMLDLPDQTLALQSFLPQQMNTNFTAETVKFHASNC